MKRTMVTDKPASAHPLGGEVEATEFRGHKLTPLNRQNIAAAKGIQCLDRATYRLTIDGLVNHPLSLSYADLQAYSQKSRLVELVCVEGWNYTAKWTGPMLSSIFEDAKIKPEARVAIFHTADAPGGFSSLDLNYILTNKIILALKDNDITLSAEKGFPFQVAALKNFKWAKWVTRIELSSDSAFRGSAESNVYNSVFCSCETGHPWWWPS
jgi:DMSO/TMAO reductase YedYZ molybdopterin-dependent catalytic subunit